MKKRRINVLILLILLSIGAVYSQNKSQKKGEEHSPEELKQMLKEMEKEMEDMDPEAKEMMKKMGIGMPDMKKREFAVSGNYTDEEPIPNRDAARIQKARQTKLNAGNLADYIRRVHQPVCAKVGPDAAQSGKEIYQTAKSSGGGAQAANGLWAFGATIPAVVVLGTTLAEAPQNPDNLNNYAAFLDMAGAEEGAIPILEYLNKIYPKNSTVLNNLGQAWFGLGELEVAGNYLDSVIAQYAGHSQANLTKSLIRESKGDKAGAIQSMKRSLKTAYSPAKEERLKKLGCKPKGADISWHGPIPQDPLGFGPVKAELKGEIYGFIEFDGQGVTDVGIKAGAKAGLITNAVEDHQVKESLGFVYDKSVTVIGTEARWGWNSGPSPEEVLNEAATVVGGGPPSEFEGFSESKYRSWVIKPNPAYYNPKASKHTPHFIDVLFQIYEPEVSCTNAKNDILKIIDFKALQEIVDKGEVPLSTSNVPASKPGITDPAKKITTKNKI